MEDSVLWLRVTNILLGTAAGAAVALIALATVRDLKAAWRRRRIERQIDQEFSRITGISKRLV